jgi:membrane-bound inhibitor of C-type lysozyme
MARYMRKKSIHTVLAVPACLALLLSGCGGVNVSLWPFDGKKESGASSAPANATEYQCNGGKHFYVRYIDNGAAAWLIYPEREVSLTKVAATSGIRYSNGIATLNVNGAEASLEDGPAIAYSGCKAVGK